MLLHHRREIRLAAIEHPFHVATLLPGVDVPFFLLLFQHFLHEPLAHSKSLRQLPNGDVPALVNRDDSFSQLNRVRLHGYPLIYSF
jgi:hypothetical protein